jgi:eukaryotic-like serine/threonine-protein kinase
MQIATGTLITDEIRLVAPIAEGTMGLIWRADHERLGIPVAVKFIQPELAAEAPDLVERFEREAKAVAQFDNDHVVRILDFGLSDRGIPYMAMELLDGQTLTDWLSRAHRLSIADTIRLVAQVASALDEAHSLGIVHRDVKPDNIFVLDGDDDMRVKLLDFGVAKHTLSGRRITLRGTVVGTAHYMSPEQIESATDVDARADLWALAVVAYEALTGMMPFAGETLGEVTEAIRACDFPPVTHLMPKGAPRSLNDWFEKALASHIDDRFETAKELSAALYATIDSQGADQTIKIKSIDFEDEEDFEDETSKRDTFPEIVTRVPTVSPPPASGVSAVEKVLRKLGGMFGRG